MVTPICGVCYTLNPPLKRKIWAVYLLMNNKQNIKIL